jgi:polyhydroxybutyrate depolymerase
VCPLLALACIREQQNSSQPQERKSAQTVAPALARTAPSLAAATEPAATFTPAQRAFEPPAPFNIPPRTSSEVERFPFVLVLHGYGVSSALLLMKSQLDRFANEKRFAYAVPDGNRNAEGRPFWNAGASCCDIDKSGVDDVKRLLALLDAARARPDVDSNRVFVIGYSNGGFMAHRLACEGGARIAAMISVSGAGPATPCAGDPGLSILEIHGDADPFVHYEGGTVLGRTDLAAHPSALESVGGWATRLGCSKRLVPGESLDIEPHLPGAETTVQRFEACRGAVELWTVHGGGHYVALERPAFEAMWAFLQQHPRAAQAPSPQR